MGAMGTLSIEKHFQVCLWLRFFFFLSSFPKSATGRKPVSMLMSPAPHLLPMEPRWHNHETLRLTEGKWHIPGNLANSGPDPDQTLMSLESQVSTQAFLSWFAVLVYPLTPSSSRPDTKRPALPCRAYFHTEEDFELRSWCEINCSALKEGILSASKPKHWALPPFYSCHLLLYFSSQ